MANEQKIWDLLYAGIGNPYGAAAMMGNMMAESSLNPKNMTGRNAKQWKSADDYILSVNCGAYDQYSFSHDGIAFGLVQWLYWSRKQALHEFAKGHDIGDIDTQIGYLMEELPKYKTVWNGLVNAADINEASDLVMLKYEKPGTVTETAKQKRRDYAFRYYDTYYIPDPVVNEPISTTSPLPVIKSGKVMTTAANVLVRCGNGKDFSPIGRIDKMNSMYSWIASSENGWHAIKFGKQVGWISGAFSKIVET